MKKSTIISVNILLAAAATAALSSCSTDFEPDLQEEHVAVLNVLLDTDSTLCARVTRSWRFSESRPDVIVTDARVRLFIDGQDRGVMTFDPGNKTYRADLKPEAGQKIRIVAETDQYGDAAGEAIVPRQPDVKFIDYKVSQYEDLNSTIYLPNGTMYHPIAYAFEYSFEISDPDGAANYYMLATGLDGSCDDPILSENETPIDAVFNKYHDYGIFSDRSFQGASYRLSFKFTYGSHEVQHLGDIDKIPEHIAKRFVSQIRIYEISQSYYLYLLSLYKKYAGLHGILEDFGVAEPYAVYSNVTPGVGIVASRNAFCYSHFVLPDIKVLQK